MSFWQWFPLLVALLAAALNAWISIQIKFAPTRDDAVKRLKSGALSLTIGVAVALSTYGFVMQIFSHAPVTRGSVFLIAFQIAGFFALGLMYVFFRMMRNVLEMMYESMKTTREAFSALYDSFNKHITITERINDTIGAVTSQSSKNE